MNTMSTLGRTACSTRSLESTDGGPLKVMFTGDVHFTPPYCHGAVFDQQVREAFAQNHFAVFNIEGPITSSRPQVQAGFVLRNAPESVATLEALHCNVFNLANNHVLDHGLAGLRDTIRVAEEHGWPVLGAGAHLEEASRLVVLRRGDISVGLVAVCGQGGVPFAGISAPGVLGDAPERRIRTLIARLKTRCDWVVVMYHGGEEYIRVPIPPKRKRLLRYLGYGADVVVAHHAHLVQRYEQVGQKYAFYGLGNLVFDLDFHRQFEGTDESVALSLCFSKNTFRFAPVFTRQDRSEHVVTKLEANPNFYPISSRSYAAEWGPVASRTLKSLWDDGHADLPRTGIKGRLFFLWKKLRRVAAWTLLLRQELLRAFVVGGIVHQIRTTLGLRP